MQYNMSLLNFSDKEFYFRHLSYRTPFLIHFNMENTAIAISLTSPNSTNFKDYSIKLAQEKAELASNT